MDFNYDAQKILFVKDNVMDQMLLMNQILFIIKKIYLLNVIIMNKILFKIN